MPFRTVNREPQPGHQRQCVAGSRGPQPQSGQVNNSENQAGSGESWPSSSSGAKSVAVVESLTEGYPHPSGCQEVSVARGYAWLGCLAAANDDSESAHLLGNYLSHASWTALALDICAGPRSYECSF